MVRSIPKMLRFSGGEGRSVYNNKFIAILKFSKYNFYKVVTPYTYFLNYRTGRKVIIEDYTVKMK